MTVRVVTHFFPLHQNQFPENHLAWVATAGRYANPFDVIKSELEKKP
jgi:hypothetical protein